MDKQTKVKVVAEVAGLAEQAKAVVLTSFKGLTVEAETKLRRDVRQVQGTYRVVRNTLARRAMTDDQWAELRKDFQGNTALVFTNDDVVGLMKTLVDFAKENEALSIRGGVFEGKPLTKNDVVALANMPPREVLIARLLGVMQSPLTGLMNVLTGSVRNLAQVVKAIADKKAEAGEA